MPRSDAPTLYALTLHGQSKGPKLVVHDPFSSCVKHIHIGIHVQSEPERLETTLASLDTERRRSNCQIILLVDGPEATALSAMAAWESLPRSATIEARGAPACFNRLVARSGADIFVFLESGVVCGHGWLDRLLAALAADPRHGLAGPSTNAAWNEQGIYPASGGGLDEVQATAGEAASRFGDETQLLLPLHSLADFCYAVRRDVVEAIGGADEGYGLGPCWEMDYNVRAARAGFRGVWVCGAYVYRSPFTARRRREEAQRFLASKHRYQDKFCGRHLRGESTAYKAHCRGDACPNFAPPTLIEQRLRLPDCERETRDREVHQPEVQPVAGVSHDIIPLASCIMPTYNRRAFLPEAVRCFLYQDYPRLELIVLDDGTDPVSDCLPEDSRVRYVRLPERKSIGAKRNLACAAAHGEFIVHWDDDDWYPAYRVSKQIHVLINENAQISGTSSLFYYDEPAGRAWTYKYAAAPKKWVAGNTLAYRKGFWITHPFPEVQVGEDCQFVWSAPPNVVCDLDEPRLCVARIHGANTSRKTVTGPYWRAYPLVEIRKMMARDPTADSPQGKSASPPSAGAGQDSSALPLVSCIMPTYNRRSFLEIALPCFRNQDYPNKELLVVDDGTDAVADMVEGVAQVRYLRLSSRASIGQKRNLACVQARGAIIAHWDDDDWYAPERLRYQVAPLLAGEAEVVGLENAFVLELPDGQCWRTAHDLHRRMFVGDVHGGTLVYWKRLFDEGVRYPEANLAEDALLIRQALKQGNRLKRLANPGLFVYVRHGRNAWQFKPGVFLDPKGWQRIGPPPCLSEEVLAAYKSAAAAAMRNE